MDGLTPFKDHFSAAAPGYARSRPSHPSELFEHLAALCARRERCWDAATGNGQAASALALRFPMVIATDASRRQIAEAPRHPRIHYAVARSEASGLAAQSVDLITVAQALHWFDLDAFYSEVRRVLRRGGILAAWCYELHAIDERMDEVMRWFYHDVVGPFWPPERRFIEDGYRTIPFPFTAIAAPAFVMEARWSFGEHLAYLGTWSAVRRHAAARGEDPVRRHERDLARAWGSPGEVKTVTWPLRLRIGTVG